MTITSSGTLPRHVATLEVEVRVRARGRDARRHGAVGASQAGAPAREPRHRPRQQVSDERPDDGHAADEQRQNQPALVGEPNLQPLPVCR